jgi:hypothetical protein
MTVLGSRRAAGCCLRQSGSSKPTRSRPRSSSVVIGEVTFGELVDDLAKSYAAPGRENLNARLRDELLNGEIFYTLRRVAGCATPTDSARPRWRNRQP